MILLVYLLIRREKSKNEERCLTDLDKYCGYDSGYEMVKNKLIPDSNVGENPLNSREKNLAARSLDPVSVKHTKLENVADDVKDSTRFKIDAKSIELNKNNRNSFHDVNLIRNFETKNRNVGSKRFTFHTFQNNTENNKTGETTTPTEHAQISKQDSFSGGDYELVNFDSYLHIATINTPMTPLSPREEFFSDLRKAADVEEKRRSILYQSSGNVKEGTSVVPETKQMEVRVDIEADPTKAIYSDVKKSVEKNETEVRRRTQPRIPSVVELVQKSGRRLSLRSSIAQDPNPNKGAPGPTAIISKDSHDGLNEVAPTHSSKGDQNGATDIGDDDVFTQQPESPVSEFFVASTPVSPNYTTETHIKISE
ncbi:hypothetical protein J6590_092642 [Homalodisca vitripennis]|nr:hypothetical protein J6590_076595 [Homalodisca vitripennis]KAG8255445.1 hypothetical protein J6590_092642 [Homalodisca vitripennis]